MTLPARVGSAPQTPDTFPEPSPDRTIICACGACPPCPQPNPEHAENEHLPALEISGPYGAVKEQSLGLYAIQMAECGFVPLAFDPSYTSKSTGKPRNVASPDISTEDFSSAVDFLAILFVLEIARLQ